MRARGMTVAAPARSGDEPAAAGGGVLDRLEMRRSVPAARLVAPGPSASELRRILTVASRVPDHGGLAPWRFVVVEKDARAALAERLAGACLAAAGEGDEHATRTAGKLRALFGQPPLVVVVVSCPRPGAKIPAGEQVLSAGAACMNLVTAATALGFGANWLTGWAATHPAARPILGLAEGESVAGVIPVGTAAEAPPDRPRPDLLAIVSTWTP